MRGGGDGWVQGRCERRSEVFVEIQKKMVGVRVDVNAMLGVGGDVGYGGC